MLESTLLLEIGSEALSELSTDEKEALLARYTDAQASVAGLKAFGLLMKKFQPNYRMGKMYEDLSDKYEAYRRIYNLYCQNINAGRTGSSGTDELKYDIQKDTFTRHVMSPTND